MDICYRKSDCISIPEFIPRDNAYFFFKEVLRLNAKISERYQNPYLLRKRGEAERLWYTVRSLAMHARIFSLLALFIMYVVSLLITMPGVCIRKTR